MPPKRRKSSGTQVTIKTLSDEDLKRLAPEAFGDTQPEPEGIRCLMKEIRGPGGVVIQAPVAYEGETVESFAARNGMSFSEAFDFILELSKNPNNPQSLIDAVLGHAYQGAVNA